MPFCSANWKVLLPLCRGLAGAGWDSLARLAALSCWAAAGIATPSTVAAQAARKRERLEPVKPAAALFFLGSHGLLAALGDFGVGIDRLAGVRGGRTAEQAVGEAAVC